MSNHMPNTRDEDTGKGAVEQDQPDQATNVSRTGRNRTPQSGRADKVFR